MKSSEVLRVLKISRPTLSRYRKNGIIKFIELSNKRFNYDPNSVYSLVNKGIPRKTYLYARVSNKNQEKDLQHQIELLKNWAIQNGFQIEGIFSDIASGVSFKHRKDFFVMLEEILTNKVEKVIITSKDRLHRVGFEFFSYLFNKFGTTITVISEVGNLKLDNKEMENEVLYLLQSYSMKIYKERVRHSIQNLMLEEET